MIQIGIIGASGFTGGELLRILERHPQVQISDILNSRTYAGQPVQNLFPELKLSAVFSNFSIPEILARKPDVLFLALPAGEAMKQAPIFLEAGIRVIDLSGDYRFHHSDIYESAYGIKHVDPTTKAVFGLCEINRDQIRSARLIANPGCYVTAALLPLMPIRQHIRQVIIDAGSGWSGAGREADPKKYMDNFVPYKVSGHRHEWEMRYHLEHQDVHFTPGVFPFYRGMVDTIHLFLKNDIDIEHELASFYKGSPFVKVMQDIPDMRQVIDTNECHIGGIVKRDGRVVITSKIDNLLKGASGQAVQNMNLMFNLRESEGLTNISK